VEKARRHLIARSLYKQPRKNSPTGARRSPEDQSRPLRTGTPRCEGEKNISQRSEGEVPRSKISEVGY